MGKLNIAHHKSYHPYRRDNIERVRRDEEEAARKDAEQDGRIALADAEARLTVLRQRAGIDGKDKEKVVEGGKHINFFEDLEQITAVRATRKTTVPEGVPLAPSTKDLHPWYADKSDQMVEDDDERRQRDLRRKSIHDPLTSITQQLASRAPSISRPRPSTDPTTARLNRESSERARAQALIRRKRGSETPSTEHGGYGDVYNRRAVEEAHAQRWRRRR